MGASVSAYWIGISEDMLEDQPEFYNDCKAWGDWMAERMNHDDVLEALEKLGCNALLSFTTEGVEDSEIDWVRPQDLRLAAKRLQEAVKKRLPGVDRILESYAISANGEDPIEKEFIQDLIDLQSIATWVENNGVESMTLAVNW